MSIPRLPHLCEDDSLAEEYSADVPQIYPESECLASARIESATTAPADAKVETKERRKAELFRDPTMGDPVNLGEASGIHTRGGKKKAGKKAQPMNWANSDNEDGAKNGEGGNGEEGGEGGGGGEGAGGDGGHGNGDGGTGGDDGDDWDFSSKKNKKNKKKAKQEQEEKEKEKDNNEEGEEKKKDDEDSAAANTLGWANETNDAKVDDEWASFSTKKDKKKKGKKVSHIKS